MKPKIRPLRIKGKKGNNDVCRLFPERQYLKYKTDIRAISVFFAAVRPAACQAADLPQMHVTSPGEARGRPPVSL